MIRRIFIAAAIAIGALPMGAHAQELPRRVLFEFGVDPAAIITRPLGALETIRGSVPCSEQYDGTTRVNFGASAWALLPVSWTNDDLTATWALRLTAGWEDLSSSFVSPTSSYPSFDPTLGRYVNVETAFRTDFEMTAFAGRLELVNTLTSSLQLRAGPSVALVVDAQSRQQEEILAPASASFADGQQERSIASGSGRIDDAGVRLGVSLGAAYRLPLGRHVFFEPALSVDVGLTSVQPAWSPIIGRLGIGVGYAVREEPAPPVVVVAAPKPEPAPPPPPPPPVFAGTVDVQRLGSDDAITLRRHVVARYVPMIPVVFFEQGVSEIPARYRRVGPVAFEEEAIPTQADQAHRHVLDLLGARLRGSADARVTLTGTSSGDEADRELLGRRRAEAVAEYLRTAWGIPPERLTVRSQLLPSIASNETHPDGREENRRVEIDVSDRSLLAPVMLRSVEPVTEPDSIAFRTSVATTLPPTRWRLQVTARDSVLRTVVGDGPPPDAFAWRLSQDDREAILAGGAVLYNLEVVGGDGVRIASSPRQLPLRLDTTISVASAAGKPASSAEFLLITFEFDQARLNALGRSELATIASRAGTGSTVEVIGYTDRLGGADYNLALAAARARAVAAQMPSGTRVTSRGAAVDDAPYDNTLPEGRFLNRTVRVVVDNPR